MPLKNFVDLSYSGLYIKLKQIAFLLDVRRCQNGGFQLCGHSIQRLLTGEHFNH